MQYFCTMLATKGRDLELNLLCGPYYRDLLKCYRVCARENELLSPSFFERYSCFTVYGEPGHFMVRLNPVTKEDHATEQSHMIQPGPTSSSTNNVPPNTSKEGDEEATFRHGGKEKTSTAANGQHQPPAVDSTKKSEDSISKMKESSAPSQDSVNPDVLQIIHDMLNKMFELIAECPETEQPFSSVLKKSTVTVADAETTEAPSSRGDGLKTSDADPQKETIEPPPLSAGAGENWDEESEETLIQPTPIVSTDSAPESEAPAPMTTTEGSAIENGDVSEKGEEVSTEPSSTVSADTVLEAISLAEAGVEEDDITDDTPQTVTDNLKDGEMEIEEKQSDTPVISSSTVPGETQLLTEPEDGESDVVEESVTGGNKIEEKQLLISVDPPCMASVARVSESSTVVEDGDAIIEPATGGGEDEEKQPQISDTPLPLTADVIPPTESTSEDWDCTANLDAEGEEKPIIVETSTLKDWADTTCIEPVAGEEEIEKNDIPVSVAAEVSLQTESEDWGATVEPIEPVTGEGAEEEDEEKQPLFSVASTPEMAITEEPSNMKDQDIVESTVTAKEKTEEDQSHDLVSSNSEVPQLQPQQSTEEDWGAESEQLPPLSLDTAADEHTLTFRETTPTSSVVTYDEGWVESEQLASCQGQLVAEQVASSTQLKPKEPKEQTPAVVFDEDCWQESVSPECISVRSVECKPLRILKRGESYEGDEPIGTQWYEHKPLPPARRMGGAAKDGGDGPEKSGGGGGGSKKSKNKKKKRGRRGQEGEERHVRFSPAPRDEARSTSGRPGEQSSSSKHTEQSFSSKDKRQSSASSRGEEQLSSSSRDRERPSSSRGSYYRGQSSSSRDSYRGYEHRQCSSEGKQRFTRERGDGDDRVSDSSQTSREDRRFDEEGGYGGGRRRRDTREFRMRRNWCMGPTGRWYEYGAGWRQDKKKDQNTDSAK